MRGFLFYRLINPYTSMRYKEIVYGGFKCFLLPEGPPFLYVKEKE
jgi:hypothetical protein